MRRPRFIPLGYTRPPFDMAAILMTTFAVYGAATPDPAITPWWLLLPAVVAKVCLAIRAQNLAVNAVIDAMRERRMKRDETRMRARFIAAMDQLNAQLRDLTKEGDEWKP